MILDYGKTGFPDTAGQAVQLEIHLFQLIGFNRPVQTGKCLLYNANQYSLMLNKPYVYLHDNQVNIIQYGIVFAYIFIKKYHENTS